MQYIKWYAIYSRTSREILAWYHVGKHDALAIAHIMSDMYCIECKIKEYDKIPTDFYYITPPSVPNKIELCDVDDETV